MSIGVQQTPFKSVVGAYGQEDHGSGKNDRFALYVQGGRNNGPITVNQRMTRT